MTDEQGTTRGRPSRGWVYDVPDKPVVITCAITGNKTTREMNPHLPVTPKEQGEAALRAVQAGASVIHLHVREDDGSESLREERYLEALHEIRARVPEAIIELSTRGGQAKGAVDSGVGVALVPALWGGRAHLKPEMCSVNIGSMNIGNELFLNPAPQVAEQSARIYAAGLVPECDVFDMGHLESALRLVHHGVLQTPLHLLLVMGIAGGISASAPNLVRMVSALPESVQWTALGVGKFQLSVVGMAILLGGNVRVGLEDTAYYRKGELATSNAQLVQRAANLCRELGREVATPEMARAMLGLRARDTSRPHAREAPRAVAAAAAAQAVCS
jgi:3-keto-5-aminohexanoate cleavage enzyme